MLERFIPRKLTFMGPNLAVFWTGVPLIVNLKAPNPEKCVYQSEHDFLAIKHANRTKNCDLWAGRGKYLDVTDVF